MDLIIVQMEHVNITYLYTDLLVEFVIIPLYCHTLFSLRCTSILSSYLQLVPSSDAVRPNFSTHFQFLPCVLSQILRSRSDFIQQRPSHRFIQCCYSFCSWFKKLHEKHPLSYQHLLHCSISSVFYKVYSFVT